MDANTLINKFNIKSVSQLNNLIENSKNDKVVNTFLISNKNAIERKLLNSQDKLLSLYSSNNNSNNNSKNESINDRIKRLSNNKSKIVSTLENVQNKIVDSKNQNNSSDNNEENNSINNLLLLFKINKNSNNLSLQEIQNLTSAFINNLKNTNANDELLPLFLDAKKKLETFFLDKTNINSNTIQNKVLALNSKLQKKKAEDENVVLERTDIDTQGTTYDKPIKQGKLNPNLKNTIIKSLIIDSKFRQFTFKSSYGSNEPDLKTNPFTIDLDHPIHDLLSFKLYSLQLPLTWDNFSNSKDNNVFFISATSNLDLLVENNPIKYMIRDTVTNNLYVDATNTFACANIYIPVVIPSNRYTNIEILVKAINNAIKESINIYKEAITDKCGIEEVDKKTDIDITFEYNKINDRVLLNIKKGSIRFFSSANSIKIDNSLGWLLGFRHVLYGPKPQPYHAMAKYDISDTKYIMIFIDDYLQNRLSTNINLTSDQTSDITTRTNLPSSTAPVILNTTAMDDIIESGLDNTLISENKSSVTIAPNKPRNYTQNELYAYSEVSNDRNSIQQIVSTHRIKPPLTSNAFAIIPIKGSSAITDNQYPYVDFSGSLQSNNREYFGPVNLRRMKITLVDDRGNIIDLKSAEWSFVLQCDILYQY